MVFLVKKEVFREKRFYVDGLDFEVVIIGILAKGRLTAIFRVSERGRSAEAVAAIGALRARS
jgi:hypothetical protein